MNSAILAIGIEVPLIEFVLFRSVERQPVADTNAQDAVRDLILSAYAEYEQAA